MPAGRVAAHEEMSVELVRKVAVVPLEEMRPCWPGEDSRLGGSDTEAGVTDDRPITDKLSNTSFLCVRLRFKIENY